MKSSLFEYYKSKYKVGGKTPVNSKGMWYQDGDVVVPSNQITMKGPNGEKDYFDSPILGIGMLSGDSQVMQPGQDYSFPNDNAVFEKKMQMGAKTKDLTLDQQTRLRNYIKEPQIENINLPSWLGLSSGATDYAKRMGQRSSEQLINNPGDISNQVSDAFKEGLDYSINAALPTKLGQLSSEGTYNPFGENTLQSMYSGLTYNKSFPKGSITLNPDRQEVQLRGKSGNVGYKRKLSNEETISQLAFNLNILPEALALYGEGRISDKNMIPSAYDSAMNTADYNLNAGVRGNAGALTYDVSGNYNPKEGYAYQGNAELSLLKDKLKLKGNVSGSQKAGVESMSAEARARLLKNLELKAGYNQSGEDRGNFNLGLSYSKAFQMGGGMSIPGINGSVVANVNSSTLKDSYKKNKK